MPIIGKSPSVTTQLIFERALIYTPCVTKVRHVHSVAQRPPPLQGSYFIPGYKDLPRLFLSLFLLLHWKDVIIVIMFIDLW